MNEENSVGKAISMVLTLRIVYAVLGLWLCLSAIAGINSPRGFAWVGIAGILAWAANFQGMKMSTGYTFSLDLSVYLFLFLVVGMPEALLTILLCDLMTMAEGLITSSLNRNWYFVLRKLDNCFVLGVALCVAVSAYNFAGGREHLSKMSYVEGIALLLFWAGFTLLNNLMFLPIDIAEEGRSAIARFPKECGIDGLLHGASVMVGATFSLLYNNLGFGPVLLMLPVFSAFVVALKRLSDQEKSLSEQRELLASLNEITSLMHQSLNIEEVFHTVQRAVQNLFGADTFFAAIFDERSGKIQFIKALDHGMELTVGDFDPDEGLTGMVLRKGEPLFIDDFFRDDFHSKVGKKTGSQIGDIRALMMAPMSDKDRNIGVFSIQSGMPGAFKPFHHELFLSFIRNIESAVISSRLYRRATEDALTRLYNRSYFEERVETCLIGRKLFAVLFFDCDNFKAINDKFGHLVGDRYLSSLGLEIQRQCRSGDIPCRFGGDEFALLLPEATADVARKVGERVRSAIGAIRLQVRGEAVGTTVSVGILWSDGTAKVVPVEDVLNKVDEALYSAKKEKSGIVEICLPQQA